MGPRRAESSEYKIYLAQLSQDFHGIYKAAVNGHYEGSCFVNDNDTNYNLTGPASMRRFRAVVQQLNINFAETHRISGHKYDIDLSCTAVFGDSNDTSSRKRTHDQMTDTDLSSPPKYIPSRMSRTKALAWVKQVLVRTRGKELIGNFNPLLVGELYWEQSSRWGNLAMEHLDKIAQTCDRFLNLLLKDKCPTDVAGRLRIAIFQNSLKARRDNAVEELSKIMEDERSYPINYNHYYTDNIAKARTDRQKRILSSAITNATTQKRTPMFGIGGPDQIAPAVDINQVVANFNGGIDPDMENVSCEEALDCLSAIYKVESKNFVANITKQVIERHLIRDLEGIFSPVKVAALPDIEVERLVTEPDASKRQRAFLEDRLKKLKDGQGVLRAVVGGDNSQEY